MTQLPPIDMFSEEFTASPEQVVRPYRDLRKPVFWEAMNAWAVFDYQQVKSGFLNESFSMSPSYSENYQPAISTDDAELYPTLTWMKENPPFINPDPEIHMAHRRMVISAFKPSAIKKIEDQIKTIFNHYTEQPFQNSTVDLAQEVNHFVPSAAIAMIFGANFGEAHDRFRESAIAYAQAINPMVDPAELPTIEEAAQYILGHVRAMVADRKSHPQDDLITHFVNTANDSSNVLTEEMISANILALISSGAAATRHGLGFVVKGLLENPQQMQLLRQDKSLLDNAALELLRYHTPVKFLFRYAKEDTEIGGESIKKGQMLLLSATGANRDERVYHEPDTLDFSRDLTENIVFGQGSHFCVGAQLAKTQMKCLIEKILELPDPKLVSVEYQTADFLGRNIKSLVIETGN